MPKRWGIGKDKTESILLPRLHTGGLSKRHPQEKLNRLEFREVDFFKRLDYIPSMGSETVSKVRPAFERLQNILFPGIPVKEENQQLEFTVGDREYFSVHFTSSEIWCGLYKDHKPSLAFRIGPAGLIRIDDGPFEVSFGKSPKIKVEGRVTIGNRGDYRAHLIGDAFDQKGFQGLADHLVDWVERAVKEGKVGKIPFSLTHSGQ